MCGIFGAARFGGIFDATDHRSFLASTDLVSYRGPDDAGYCTFAVGEGRVASPSAFDVFLGHRRLAIIDLSAHGRQPMTDHKGRWIVFNGEIFNYVELRAELQALGYRFHTATDTEVILHVYDAFGTGGFHKLNGMWALALLDLPRRQLALSRDRFSIKPLYYWRDSRRLLFASEIKQLLPLMPHRELDPHTMYRYLAQAVADTDEHTFFAGVRAVKPKHTLVFDLDAGGTAEAAPYWTYGETPVLKPAAAVEAFRDLFIDSVRIRLRSDVEVGALVSGGLDSSAIAVAANHVLHAGLQTFSIVAREEDYSEGPFVQVLADAGIPNCRIVFDTEGALDSLDDVVYHNDEPCFGLSIIAQYRMLERIKATGIKVILSGQGGDECLMGYHKFFYFYVAELLRGGRLLKAATTVLASLVRGTTARQFRWGEARRYLPDRWTKRMPFLRLRGEPARIGGARTVRDRQRLDLDRYSVPILAHFEDRNSMAHSVEIRNPFLDHRLVDLALNLPADLKIRHGWPKYVLREALPELPAAIRWRRDKQGFLTPEALWLRTALRPVIERDLAPATSHLGKLDIIDPAAFLAYYRRFVQRDRMIWYADISRVFLAERWARRFLSLG